MSSPLIEINASSLWLRSNMQSLLLLDTPILLRDRDDCFVERMYHLTQRRCYHPKINGHISQNMTAVVGFLYFLLVTNSRHLCLSPVVKLGFSWVPGTLGVGLVSNLSFNIVVTRRCEGEA